MITPAQDAHTPREQPQTRSGGTESGEGRGGAWEGCAYEWCDRCQRMVSVHICRTCQHPMHRETVDMECQTCGRDYSLEEGTTPEQAYGNKHLQREVEALRAQTARDRADLDAAASMRERLEHEVTKLREAQAIITAERDTHLQGLARVAEERNALNRRVERVRALLAETGHTVSCGGMNVTDDGCYAGDLARRILAALDGANSKAAPSDAKTCSNEEAGT